MFVTVPAIIRVALLLLLLPLAAACDDDEDAVDAALTAPEILARASRQLAETETVHFDLDIQGQTFVDEGDTIQLLAAQGALARPDRVQTRFKAKLLGAATVTIQLITIGDRSWTTDLVSGEWGPAPEEFGYSPTILFDMQQGLGPVMGAVEDPALIGVEEIDGREAYHIRAEAEESLIEPLTSGTMEGSPVTVDLWIAAETFDLLRAQLQEPPAADKADPATWVLDVSRHGEQVTIEPPI